MPPALPPTAACGGGPGVGRDRDTGAVAVTIFDTPCGRDQEALEAGAIHLWFSRPGPVSEEWLDHASRLILPERERDGSRRFRFARDRRRFLLTRLMLRTTLSRYAALRPADWIFSANPFGRPFIANAHFDRPVQFNISHTDGLIALAIVRNAPIGIDIERMRRIEARDDIASRFFAPTEAGALRALPTALRDGRFIDLWTLKEAYIKARSRGLSIPLDSFAFSLSPGRIRFTTGSNEPQADLGSWHFVQFTVPEDHVGALCIELPGEPAPRIIAREAVPGQAARCVDLTIMRRSR